MSSGNCSPGFYEVGKDCFPIPQKCIPPTYWSDNRCKAQDNNCPKNTYFRNGNCLPYIPCQNGQKWDQNLINCVCPEGTEWNGEKCLVCGGGKIW